MIERENAKADSLFYVCCSKFEFLSESIERETYMNPDLWRLDFL